MTTFDIDIRPGDFVAYVPPGSHDCTLGRVKRRGEGGWFVWYTAGDTAALTPWNLLRRLRSPYQVPSRIDPYDLGGADARRLFADGYGHACDELVARDDRFRDRRLCPAFDGPDCPLRVSGAICLMTEARLESTLGPRT